MGEDLGHHGGIFDGGDDRQGTAALSICLGTDHGCGLARPRNLVGESPTQVTASHGPGIEPCR
jgi:hypothetical protein